MYCYGLVTNSDNEITHYLMSDHVGNTGDKISMFPLSLIPVEEVNSTNSLFYVLVATADSRGVYVTPSFTENIVVNNVSYNMLTFRLKDIVLSNTDSDFTPVHIDGIYRKHFKDNVVYTIYSKHITPIAEYLTATFPTMIDCTSNAAGSLFRGVLPFVDFEKLCKVTSKYLFLPSMDLKENIPPPRSKSCSKYNSDFFGRRISYYYKSNNCPNLDKLPNIYHYMTQRGYSKSELVRTLPMLYKYYSVVNVEDLEPLIDRKEF